MTGPRYKLVGENWPGRVTMHLQSAKIHPKALLKRKGYLSTSIFKICTPTKVQGREDGVAHDMKMLLVPDTNAFREVVES